MAKEAAEKAEAERISPVKKVLQGCRGRVEELICTAAHAPSGDGRGEPENRA